MPSRQLVPVCLLLVLVACHRAGDIAEDPVLAPTEDEALRPIAWSELLPPAPPADPGLVAGSAEAMPRQAPPQVDDDQIGARLEVRRLPVPRVPSGAAAPFEMPDGDSGWVTSLPGHEVLLTPAFGGEHVFVGGGFSATTLFALDADSGQIDWHVAAPDGGPTAAIYYDDTVYFNTESCTLFAVDGQEGRTLWSRRLGDPLMSMPAAADGRVFSGHLWNESSTRYGFTAMDAASGRVLWQREIPHDVISAPTTVGDSVYFATMDGSVYRLRQRDGRLIWRRWLRATTAPWVDGDRMLLARRVRPPEGARGAHEQQLVLDADSGEILWEGEPVAASHLYGRGRARRLMAGQRGAWGGPQGRAHAHLGVRNVAEGWAYQGPRPSVIDGRAYQVVGDRIECRRLEDGELLWSRRYDRGDGALAMSPPAIVGSQMVVATVEGHVYGLDIDTGMAVWAYDVGQPIVYQPSVARGRVYVATARGQVVAFPVGDAETLDGWHMWGGDASHSGLAADPAAVDWDDPALLLSPADGQTRSPEDEGPSEGELRIIVPDENRVEALPLEHTRVNARISGFVASVTLEQVFRNDLDEPFEAAYHFPLPTGAAVDGMVIRAGDRVILGRIERKEQARIIYRRAREAGLLAALLEQQRPNLFTQRVANIPPGQSVSVEIHYVQLLPYDQGEYEFLFPLVAGARAQDPTAGDGGATVEQHTPGTRPSEQVEIALSIDAGVPIEALDSPTHLIEVARASDSEAQVELAPEDRIPNRDFLLRYSVGAELPRTAALSHSDERGGFFTLVIQPGLELPEELATRRRLTFALDTSSSMLGRPLAQARAIVNEALASLGPEDELQVVTFSDLVRAYAADGPVAATDDQVIGAEQFVDDQRALGTTSMTAGLERALGQPEADDEVLDLIVLVTDGYVAGEEALMRLVHQRLGRRRLYTVGVGPAPNRFLLERLAEFGRGASVVVSPSEMPEVVAQQFLERITAPQLTDIELDWGELTVHSVYPRRIPDLFGGQPLIIRGRYELPGEDHVTLRGRIGGRLWQEQVPVVLASADVGGNDALAPIWARAAVHDLMNGLYLRNDPDRQEAVTDLGLRFGLVTRFTSFVAVEDRFLSGVGSGGVGEELGYGGLGLQGLGTGGGGSGEGNHGLGSLGSVGSGSGVRRAAGLPTVRTGRAMVRGTLSRETVRRTIRMHTNELRGVYERHLMLDPSLEGRVVVRLTIGPDGVVMAVSIASSTLEHELTERGLLEVFRRMRFPAVPNGGTYLVNYPLVFRPSEP